MRKVVFVIGPTASGKSSFSVQMAKYLGAEIISADSMQIYRHLDIGTAKIMPSEMEGVPHHMLNLIDPDETYSVQQYQYRAREIIKRLHADGILPVITGGTGLYLQSLLYDLDFSGVQPDRDFREELAICSDLQLYERLLRVNPEMAKQIHPNNRKRIIRALEIAKSGVTQETRRFDTPAETLDPIVIGLDIDRTVLWERIEQRVDQMLQSGLIEECEKMLLPHGYHTQAGAAIGYAETADYLRGFCTRDELRRNIIVHTRQYAKRQRTWFRRMDAHWVPYDSDPIQIVKELL